MGNRAAIGFRANQFVDNTLFLYIHWAPADDLTLLLAEAVKHTSNRWDDPAYATRMAITHLIGDQYDSEHGYGLTINSVPDLDIPVIPVIYWGEQIVRLHDRDLRYIADSQDSFEAILRHANML
jgi:hypothetical protein